MILEQFISDINANIYLREFSFDKNKFNLSADAEVEFADNVVWIDDLLIIFQLKEREVSSALSEKTERKWFEKKVIGKGTKQIRDSLIFLNQHNNISIKNQRGHSFTLSINPLSTIIKIVLYAPIDKYGNEVYSRYYISRTAGFIHVLPIHDYLRICQTLITPAEIKEYYLFRESIFYKYQNQNSVSEPALVGQFLCGEFDKSPSEQYINYYKAFLNTVQEFDLTSFLGVMAEHIDYSKSSIGPLDYYRILIEFAKLKRPMLKEIKTRIKLCMDASHNNEIKKPYRVTAPTGCGFVFIPIPQDLNEYRRSALINLTHAAKYDQKLENVLGFQLLPKTESL